MIAAVIVIVVIGYLLFHIGAGHSNYRHARAHGHGRSPSLYIGARGPWLTIPGPFGTRIGHRI